MFDHFGFRVRDLAASRRFYDAVAGALGLATIDNTPSSFLLCRAADETVPFLWIGTDRPAFWTAAHHTSASPVHFAFAAASKSEVDAFHKAALENGGNNIEAGCRN